MVDELIAFLFLMVFIFYLLKVYFHFKYLASILKLKSSLGEVLLHPFRYNLIKFKLFFLFFFFENPLQIIKIEDRKNLLLAKIWFYTMWFTILVIAGLIIFYKH